MNKTCLLLLLVTLAQQSLVAEDLKSDLTQEWPAWRGPAGNGHAPSQQTPPTEWDEKQNIQWKAKIPGKGHGSPIVVGDSVYLATSLDNLEIRAVHCYDRQTGKEKWSLPVHTGKATLPRNKKGTQASSTPACDGERIYINFLHADAMYTSAISLGGELLWQTKITPYVVHQGFGSSPLLYEQLVIVSADNKAGGAVAALDKLTGEIKWKHDRPKTPNYPSPVLVNNSGMEQLIMTGCDLVTSLNPKTGKVNWEIEGATTECVTSTVTDGKHIYSSGGYPKNHVAAIKTDGSGEIAWENGVRVYVPSMIVKEGYLFAVTDAGVAMCWKSDTGEEIWKGRLGGTFSSSLVLVDDHLYATNEEAQTYVFKASAADFDLIAKNQLGQICFATPAICNSGIYHRVAVMEEGKRVEYLYCIAD